MIRGIEKFVGALLSALLWFIAAALAIVACGLLFIATAFGAVASRLSPDDSAGDTPKPGPGDA